MQIQAITTPSLVISFEGEEAAAFYSAAKHVAELLANNDDAAEPHLRSEKTAWAALILGNFANGIAPAFVENAPVIEHED